MHRHIHSIGLRLALAVCLWVGGSTPAWAVAADLGELLPALGFEQDDADDLLSGKVLAGELTEGGGKELAITLALFVKAPPSKIAHAVRDGETLHASRDVLAEATLTDAASAAAALGKISLPDKEVVALSQAEAGSDFNLSSDEIAALRAASGGKSAKEVAADANLRAAVADAYRKALAQRLGAYQAKGLAGIAAYDRGGSRSQPSEELAGALGRDAVLRQRQAEVYAALESFPKKPLAGAEHQFLGLLQDANGRPAMVLSHRMFVDLPHGALLAERQFFVGHSYNSLQVLIGVVPVDGGSVVFYRNRTFTDQVTGFGGAAKRGIGETMMRDAISAKLEAIRSKVFE